MNFNTNYARKRLHKGSRVKLKPLIEKQVELYKNEETLQIWKERENIFSSPQPIKLNLDTKLDKFNTIDKKQEFSLKKLKKEKIPIAKSSLKSSPLKRSDTPPNIKKIEKFWEKIGKIKEFNLDSLPMHSLAQPIKVSSSMKMGKCKTIGMPARFKELVLSKSNSDKVILNKKVVEKDLFIIKVNDGSDIAERIKVAKLAKLYENSNKDGILKRKNIEDSWKWYTPKGTPSDKTVRFDFEFNS